MSDQKNDKPELRVCLLNAPPVAEAEITTF